MIRLILPAVIAGTMATADEMPCVAHDSSPESCLMIIGCIEKPRFFKEDLTFTGRMQGANLGSITLTLSNDVTCEGTWVASRTAPIATAAIICADGLGLKIDSVEISKDEVLSIEGEDDTGRHIRAWSDRSGSIATLMEKTFQQRLTNIRTCTFEGEFSELTK